MRTVDYPVHPQLAGLPNNNHKCSYTDGFERAVVGKTLACMLHFSFSDVSARKLAEVNNLSQSEDAMVNAKEHTLYK